MWKELGLRSEVVEALKKCGFEKPTEIQQKSIKSILQGKDLVGGSATGSGKTLAFGLPVIEKLQFEEKGIEALIVCPTRELAIQVCDEIKKVAVAVDKSIKVVPIYGGADFQRQVGQLVKGAKIVVGTPGRILDHLERKSLKLKHCNMLILDEADEMLSMGFRPDIEKILAKFKSKPQILLFSATMPKDILALIDKYLQEPKYVMIETSNKPNENITQYYVNVKKDGKMDALLALAKNIKKEKSLIFCNTKAMTERVSKHLRDYGFKSDMLNGDMSQQVRKKVLDNFKAGELQFLVCTDVASRGIDIDSLPYVINYDMPKMNEWYIHRIGRTGRKDNKGKAITFINKDDQLNNLIKLAKDGGFIVNKMEIDTDKIKQEKKVDKNLIKQKNKDKNASISKNDLGRIKEKTNKNKIKKDKINQFENNKFNKNPNKDKKQFDSENKAHNKNANKSKTYAKNVEKISVKNKVISNKNRGEKFAKKSKNNSDDDFGYEGMSLQDFYEIFKDDMKTNSFKGKGSKKRK